MERYETCAKLASGRFTTVYLARDTQADGALVAVKVFQQAHCMPQVLKSAIREARLLRELGGHPHIVQLQHSLRSESGRVYLILEYLPRPLFSLMPGSGDGMPLDTVLRLSHQLLSAIQFLHKNKVIHRDLKPSSLMLSESGDLKLIDFGAAREDRPQDRLTPYVVTRWYRAPEVLTGLPYGAEIDIWAAGCVIAEMATGQPLFPGTSQIDQLQMLLECFGELPSMLMGACSEMLSKHVLVLPEPEDCVGLRTRLSQVPDVLFSIIESCLQPDPLERPGAGELLALPCFGHLERCAAAPSLKSPSLRLQRCQSMRIASGGTGTSPEGEPISALSGSAGNALGACAEDRPTHLPSQRGSSGEGISSPLHSAAVMFNAAGVSSLAVQSDLLQVGGEGSLRGAGNFSPQGPSGGQPRSGAASAHSVLAGDSATLSAEASGGLANLTPFAAEDVAALMAGVSGQAAAAGNSDASLAPIQSDASWRAEEGTSSPDHLGHYAVSPTKRATMATPGSRGMPSRQSLNSSSDVPPSGLRVSAAEGLRHMFSRESPAVTPRSDRSGDAASMVRMRALDALQTRLSKQLTGPLSPQQEHSAPLQPVPPPGAAPESPLGFKTAARHASFTIKRPAVPRASPKASVTSTDLRGNTRGSLDMPSPRMMAPDLHRKASVPTDLLPRPSDPTLPQSGAPLQPTPHRLVGLATDAKSPRACPASARGTRFEWAGKLTGTASPAPAPATVAGSARRAGGLRRSLDVIATATANAMGSVRSVVVGVGGAGATMGATRTSAASGVGVMATQSSRSLLHSSSSTEPPPGSPFKRISCPLPYEELPGAGVPLDVGRAVPGPFSPVPPALPPPPRVTPGVVYSNEVFTPAANAAATARVGPGSRASDGANSVGGGTADGVEQDGGQEEDAAHTWMGWRGRVVQQRRHLTAISAAITADQGANRKQMVADTAAIMAAARLRAGRP